MVATAKSLLLELQRRGYGGSWGHTKEGADCTILRGPNGRIDPPFVIHRRNPLYPDNGDFWWKLGSTVHRVPLDTDTSQLADALIASLEEAGV